jgi:hypothetical protein
MEAPITSPSQRPLSFTVTVTAPTADHRWTKGYATAEMADDHLFSATRQPYEHPAHQSYSCDQCRKQYSSIHHLNKHQRSGCANTKRSLSLLLADTKSFWESRKKRRLQANQGPSSDSPTSPQPTVDDLNLSSIGSSRVARLTVSIRPRTRMKSN